MVLIVLVFTNYNLEQIVISPDGQRIAEIHKSPWVDDEPTQVRVYHRSFPFVQRIVCTHPWVSAIEWKGDDTLQLEGQHISCPKEINMRTIGPAREVSGSPVPKYAIYGTLLAGLIIPIVWYTPEILGLLKRTQETLDDIKKV